MSVVTYYDDKSNRSHLRQTLNETQRKNVANGWEVLITTYNLAQGDEKDRKFFRRINWDVSDIIFRAHILVIHNRGSRHVYSMKGMF